MKNKQIKNYKIFSYSFCFVVLVYIFLFLSIPVLAAETTFIPQVKIGEYNVGVGTAITKTSIGDYINAIYKWAVGALIVLAVVMIMVAGFQWMTAGGSGSAITKAKGRITQALIGLLLGIGAYTLLNFINPSLVNLRDIKLGNVEGVEKEFGKRVFCVYFEGQDPTECQEKEELKIHTYIGGEGYKGEWTYVANNEKSGESCGNVIVGDFGANEKKKYIYTNCPEKEYCVLGAGIYSKENPLSFSGYNSEKAYKGAKCIYAYKFTTACSGANDKATCEALNGDYCEVCKFENNQCLVKAYCGLIDKNEKKLAGKNLICCACPSTKHGAAADYFYVSTESGKNKCSDICKQGCIEAGLSACQEIKGF